MKTRELLALDDIAGRLATLRAAMAEKSSDGAKHPVDLDRTDDLKKLVREVERHVIARVMRKVDGNQSRAAYALNISRGALIAKIKEYGLHRPGGAHAKSVGTIARKNSRLDPEARKARASGSKRPSSKERLALRRLQGRFMGILRGLSKSEAHRVKKIRAAKGYPEGIRAAEALRRRK